MTTHWTPSFPNGQETTWPSVRLNSIFNTNHSGIDKTGNTNRTHATINDNDRQAKMIDQTTTNWKLD